MSVKALARGLQVLSAVNDLNPAYVKDVVESTELPKATVIRLLKSLVEEGYLVHHDSGQGYRVTAAARKLSRALGERSRYSAVSEPILTQLGSLVKYPAIFSIRDSDSLVIEATNRSTAPIRMQLFERTRLPIINTAAGVAYLSSLDQEECEQTITSLCQQHQNFESSPSVDSLVASINESRQTGFASREYPSLRNATAMAIPVRENGRPLGALTLVYFDDLTHPDVRNDHLLKGMRDAVSSIEASLTSQSQTQPLVDAQPIAPTGFDRVD